MNSDTHFAHKAWRISGTVQGVGFRPWICRTAEKIGLSGFVYNESGAVRIEAYGRPDAIHAFLSALKQNVPPPAKIASIVEVPACLVEENCTGFQIRNSQPVSGASTPQVAPDLAMCPDCRTEVFDPASRRFRYPFTTCARCGPRYTILQDLPFDRARTTMADFPLCTECLREYADPADRRFHAQSMACPACGPHLIWLDASGQPLADKEDALAAAVHALIAGRIVAVKGLGGFHLMVRADSEPDVCRLRKLKIRPAKPLAIMVRDAAAAHLLGKFSLLELQAISSPAAPIVLVSGIDGTSQLAPSIARHVPHLGLLLAATPLHALLLEALPFPVVATSANRSEEPICTDTIEAVQRLRGIADFFLSNNRRIANRCDDSIVAELDGGISVFRRARGFVPVAIPWPVTLGARAILGAGGHQKNAPAILFGGTLLPAPHVGDLDSPLSRSAWLESVDLLNHLTDGHHFSLVATDIHPDYGSTIEASKWHLQTTSVQHHAAHAFAALAESGWDSALAVVWDGTGLGTDRTSWGGEFLEVEKCGKWNRIGSLRPFDLPSGDLAAREPLRSAIACLHEMFGDSWTNHLPRLKPIDPATPAISRFLAALRSGLSAHPTTSAGRLFDAAAFLLGLADGKTYEGQAAMALEAAASRIQKHETPAAMALASRFQIPVRFSESSAYPFRLDWAPAIEMCLEAGSPHVAAAAWHVILAQAVATAASQSNHDRILLTGGCFQNVVLSNRTAKLLRKTGCNVFIPRLLPINDGGLASGQATAAALWNSCHA